MAMNDETAAPAAKRRMKTPTSKRRRKMPAAKRRKTTKEKVPDMPYELVSDILLRLPIESLMRFKCICKAWRDIISEDPSFLRAHLSVQRQQRPHVLIAPRGKGPNYGELLYDTTSINKVTTVGLYRWEEFLDWATLLNDLESFPAAVTHEFAHCDGLVLVPTDGTVRVINPATRRVLPLPSSPHSAGPRKLPRRLASHQAFGLGLDPCSNAYKIARFFYASIREYQAVYRYNIRMEVFTIGQLGWHETATQPPYPVIVRRTATFVKGSLFWTVDERILGHAAPGYLRLRLDNEAFSITPPPLCCPSINYLTSNLSELHGELCVAQIGRGNDTLEMWMCNDVDGADPPQWDRRYTVIVSSNFPRSIRPIVAFPNGVLVLHVSPKFLRRYKLQTPEAGAMDETNMVGLMYQDTDDFGYLTEAVIDFDVIPYISTIVPI